MLDCFLEAICIYEREKKKECEYFVITIVILSSPYMLTSNFYFLVYQFSPIM